MLTNILGEGNAGENWATLLEYGTKNRKEIALQNLGLSRYSAKKILKSCSQVIEIDNGQLKDLNKTVILSHFEKDSIEYAEINKIL